MNLLVINNLKDYKKIKNSKKENLYFSEDLTTAYPIKENGEGLVSLIDAFSAENLEISYSPPKDLEKKVKIPQVRKALALKLVKAAKKLPPGLRFKVSEGFRPMWYQTKVFKEIFTQIKNKNLRKSDLEVWEIVTQYVADPELTPPHTTGGAIDITIENLNGEELDMGTSLNTVDSKSNTFSEGLTKGQKRNRQILYEALSSVGCVNLPTEWWHYSFGDQYWALARSKPVAIYGSIKEAE